MISGHCQMSHRILSDGQKYGRAFSRLHSIDATFHMHARSMQCAGIPNVAAAEVSELVWDEKEEKRMKKNKKKDKEIAQPDCGPRMR